MTDDETQVSIRIPTHPFYKLGVMVEEHSLHEVLRALCDYCHAKIEETIDANDPDEMWIEWGISEALIDAAAYKTWSIFTKDLDEPPTAEATHNGPESKQ